MNQQAAMNLRLTEQQQKRARALKRQQALRQAALQRAGSSEAQQQLTDMEVELRNIHDANKTILHVRSGLSLCGIPLSMHALRSVRIMFLK